MTLILARWLAIESVLIFSDLPVLLEMKRATALEDFAAPVGLDIILSILTVVVNPVHLD
jgi:hypothetical protein